MLKLDCFLKGIWRSLKATFRSGNICNIDGCDYVETETHENVTVIISECEHCGKVDVSWKQ